MRLATDSVVLEPLAPWLAAAAGAGLKPGVTYFYSPGVGTTGGGVAASKEYNFTVRTSSAIHSSDVQLHC